MRIFIRIIGLYSGKLIMFRYKLVSKKAKTIVVRYMSSSCTYLYLSLYIYTYLATSVR